MIRGIIHNKQPLISVVVGWKRGVQELVALADTGFTGELKAPPDKVREFGLEVTHTEPVSLGDEQVVTMSASLAYVSMEGVPNIVGVLIGEGIPIVGVGLLKKFGYTLNIDFKYDTLFLKK